MRHALFVLLAVVGMMPASILPVVVFAGRHELSFTISQSAALGTAAILSAAMGALMVALIGAPARWKVLVAVALVTLGSLDVASMRVAAFVPLLSMRAMHGFVGGMLTGIGYTGIGRATSPDRLFGVLLAMQFLVGGAGIAVLPGMIVSHGVWLLFAVLASTATLMLVLVPAMPNIALAPTEAERPLKSRRPRGAALWGLAALLLIEAGHTAGGAFMLELGRGRGIGMTAVQSIVGLGAMAGIIGAVGAAVQGARWGRAVPVLCATIASLGAAALLLVPSPIAFAGGAVVGSIAWAWSIPLVLGGCAALGPDKHVAIWLSFVAKLGLAAGPLLGALVVTGGRFEPAILLSCVLGGAGALMFLRVDRGTVAQAS